jgi:DNA-directed RNA polymerase specialized sigma24 family protein
MDDVSVSDAREPEVGEWFDDVYRLHWTGMVRLAFVMVGDAGLAEELAQDAFARVYGARASVNDPLPYLRSAVYNVCRNHFRSESRRRRVPSPQRDGAPFGDHVIDVVRRLPARQQALVVLRYYEGLSDAEISAATGIPLGSVKSGLHRALASMRKELQ